jgi:hypothetical protein
MLQDDTVPVIYVNSIETRKRGLLSDLESIHTTDGELWIPSPLESSLLFMEALQRAIITVPERLLRKIAQNSINPITDESIRTLEGITKRLSQLQNEVVYFYGNNVSILTFGKNIAIINHLAMNWFEVFGINSSEITQVIVKQGGKISNEDGRIWSALANLFGYSLDWIPAYAPWLIWLRHRENPWLRISE